MNGPFDIRLILFKIAPRGFVRYIEDFNKASYGGLSVKSKSCGVS